MALLEEVDEELELSDFVVEAVSDDFEEEDSDVVLEEEESLLDDELSLEVLSDDDEPARESVR